MKLNPPAPPKLIEIISTPESTHQSTAAAIVSSTPSPCEFIAFATYKSAFGETPFIHPSAQISPDIAVP